MAFTRKPNNPNPNSSLPPLPPQSNPTTDLPPPPAEPAPEPVAIETVSDYEKTREQRIKENRERLEKLGIVDLSNQLKSVSANNTPRRTPKYERRTPLKSPSLGPPEPRRRSSRLQDAPAVVYAEPKEPKKLRKTRDVVLEVGSRPEYYTEEHDKLLGSTEMPWTFFVDGYVNGSRVYDSVTGKTCHQCRQKTLGKRTRCSNCTLVQGQFCGDCLYMRYGEHVVEANQNPDWICPPCRGICNCSLCRQAKGWYPTGALYKTIRNLGYRSVAHYLIETKREPPAEETVSETQQSAKRALPFEGMDVLTDGLDDKAPVNTESEDEPTPENADASYESARNAVVADDVHAPDKKSSEVITNGSERARRRSTRGNADVTERVLNSENADVGEESMVKAGMADQKLSVVSGRGRPRKRATAETVAVVEGTVIAGAGDMTEHEPNPEIVGAGDESTMKADVTDQKRSEVSGNGRGRQRKRAKTETAAVAEGALTPENADVAKDAGAPDKRIPEVVKRERPRTRSVVGKADVAEDASVPKNTSAGDLAEQEPIPENVDAGEESVMNAAVTKRVRGRGRPQKTSMTGNAAMMEDSAMPESISVF